MVAYKKYNFLQYGLATYTNTIPYLHYLLNVQLLTVHYTAYWLEEAGVLLNKTYN